MWMKAQSELTGDRKRRAEMTRPRFGGATAWINGIDRTLSLHSSFAKPEILEAMTRFDTVLSCASAVPTLDMSDPEVNHCPAGQQRPVCTP